MQKTIPKKVTFCDICGKEEIYAHTCLGCGKQACLECRKTNFIDYSHSVFFSGFGDGDFCNSCNKNPPAKIIPLMEAYKRIKSLRSENKEWYADFEKQSDEADAKVKEERAKLSLD